MIKTIVICLYLVLAQFCYLQSQTKDYNEIQRKATKAFDSQKNAMSNVEFYTTNFGIFSNNININAGGGFWPRGSENQYFFAAGFWFGAVKRINGGSTFGKLVELSYNHNNGKSWMIPGRIEDSDSIYKKDITKYRSYYSTDFKKETGEPNDNTEGQNWPYWKTSQFDKLPLNSNTNSYVYDELKRNTKDNNFGPNYISDEDIHSVYKDTYLGAYDGGYTYRKNLGYPLRLQFEEHIYSWKNPLLKDVVVQVFDITNTSNDTLINCYFAPVSDIDICAKGNYLVGAANDRSRYFSEYECARLGVFWSGTEYGEKGKGFGYLGISFLEAPTVDQNNFLKKEKLIYDKSEQIQKITFRNWDISQDIPGDVERYQFISSLLADGDNGPSDKRSMLSTGPFNMLPGEKTRIAVAYIFALPAKNAEADGSTEDLTGSSKFGTDCDNIPTNEGSLIKKYQDISNYYYNKLLLDIVENSKNTNEYIISPNPASDYIEISLDSPSTERGFGDVLFEIFNIFGEKISTLSSLRDATLKEGNLRINVSNLPSGVYFIKIGDKFEKFIKC